VSLSEQIPYEHIPHPHVAAHRRARPVRVADQLGRGSAPARFNAWLAVKITIVGQNILAAASDKRAEDTYNDAEAVLVQSEKIQEHLMGQDAAIGKLLERVEAIAAKMATATS